MAADPNRDRYFMRLAIREARKGLGRTSPNPCVGAVVVKNGKVVAKGFHHRAGTPHAEVHVLEAAGAEARGATLYVTLEPCNHQGRTPPCTEKVLASGILRVVVGMNDPNPIVKGGGNAFLQSRGVAVVSGVLSEECRALNRPFIKYITTGRPWVIMKSGQSLDGRIATRSGHSQWITQAPARGRTHLWRDRVDAILVGIDTVLADNPYLTARPGRGRGHDPLRVILDSTLRLPLTAHILSQESKARTLVYCGNKAAPGHRRVLVEAGAEVVEVKDHPQGGLNLAEVLDDLGRREINSLLVEGGGRVHAAFLKSGLYDQACIFVAPLFLGADGLPVVGELGLDRIEQGKRFTVERVRRLGPDVMIEGIFGE